MKAFNVVASASLLQHNNHQRLVEAARIYFAGLGYELWSANQKWPETDVWRFAFREDEEGVEQAVTQEICDAFMLAHDNSTLTDKQRSEAQMDSANMDLGSLFSGLDALSAEDAAYAAMGRAMARKDGALPAVIAAIVDRNTARTYLLNKAEWTALPLAAKNWLADQLDMEAVLFQALILVLRR